MDYKINKKTAGDSDLMILGAGLTGLSAGYHSDGTVYEKEDMAGGLCRAERLEGYIFDRGSHIFHGRDPYVLNLLENALKVGFNKKLRSSWIYSHGVYTKYPFQVNTYGLPKNIVTDCVNGFVEAYSKPRKKRFDNYKDWIYSTFGKGIAEYFYIPYSEKFWTIPVEEMTTDWLDVRVPMPRPEDVIEGAASYKTREFGPNAEFRYPEKGGMVAIADGFLTKDFNLNLKKEAVSIDSDNKIVEFLDGKKVNYKTMISTIPLPDFIQMLNNAPAEIKRLSEGLRCNSVFCVYLGVNREKIDDRHWLYFPEDDFPFFRVSFPMNLSPSSAPKKRSSIVAEISYSSAKPIDRSAIIDKTIKALVKAGILSETDKIEKIGSYDIKYGYPIYDHSRRENVSIIERYLKEMSILPAGRYGRWEYLWMHDAILNGKRAAEEADQMGHPGIKYA